MPSANEFTATAAAARIRAGDLGAEELVRACLARIAAREADVGAWAWIDPALAIAQARAADAARARGEALGPLHGVPVGVKDVIDTGDMPTGHGSPIFTGNRPERDAACVSALRAAGAVILGKTVTTELANTHPGRTRNPHRLTHTPGGSSSGSAAAVADVQVPLALGTQTGGSVIRPGSFCGIPALKPTLGLIPRRGVLLQSHTLDTVGVYGRCVADLALAAEVLSRHDPDDPASDRHPRQPLLAALDAPRDVAPRFAFVQTPAWPQAVPAAQDALQAFAASLGAACEPADLPAPFERIVEFHSAVMNVEDLYHYGRFLDTTPELLSTHLRQRLEAARATTAQQYAEALEARARIHADLVRLLERFDAVLCLPATGPAPESLASTGSAVFNGLWTYLGVPCVTLPLLAVDGLPLGVQLVGRRRGEAALLRTARWLEARPAAADAAGR